MRKSELPEAVDHERRRLLGVAAAGVAVAGAAALLTPDPARAAGGGDIRPFTVDVPQAALDDLQRRLAATRWPPAELVTDASQGVQLATMQALVAYWQAYDWRKTEAKLNALPQFITTIDGLDIHFIHVRSKHEDALPLIVTHGWPGSVIEQLKIVGPLTDPTAHGGTAADAFHLVIPSMPGYGFSGKPDATGWGPIQIAKANIELMQRLGYTRYVAQGGDWGALITEQMALIAPPGLLAMHTNMPGAVPPEISKALHDGAPPAGLSPQESQAYEQLADFYAHGLGYAIEMANRPQTLYGIVDSPAGLASFIIDHDIRSYQLIARIFAGESAGLTREDIVENITLYWLTGTAISSAQLYWENKLPFFDVKGVAIPVAVSVFAEEIYAAPETWVRAAFPKLIHFNRFEKGTHFAAWEQTDVFVTEMRASFVSVR